MDQLPHQELLEQARSHQREIADEFRRDHLASKLDRPPLTLFLPAGLIGGPKRVAGPVLDFLRTVGDYRPMRRKPLARGR